MREGLPGSAGILVTLSRFTAAAIAEAGKVGIELVDNDEFIRRLERVRASERCPRCATPMVLGRSPHGWWLRCPRWSQGCAGKRDLGANPGRAVELLLDD
jgi:hypothetical protein